MRNGDIFIEEFNNLEAFLCKKNKISKHTKFYKLVDLLIETNAEIQEFESHLRSAGNLRNAILHWRKYPQTIIADPDTDFLNHFIKISHNIQKPKLAENIGSGTKDVFTITDTLEKVLVEMHHNDFSQILYKSDEGFSLITREGIAKWLERNIETDIVSLKDITLYDVSNHEDSENWVYIPKQMNIYEIKKLFSNPERRLQAAIVTPNGEMTEKPLRIITPWDISREIDLQ